MDGLGGHDALRRGRRRTHRTLVMSGRALGQDPVMRAILLSRVRLSHGSRRRGGGRRRAGWLRVGASSQILVEERRTRVDLVRLRVRDVLLNILAVGWRSRGRHGLKPIAVRLVQVRHGRASLA